MIKAIIIDDEKRCISALQHDIQAHCPNIEVMEVCDSGKSGIIAIGKLKPDLVFLDIEMPLMDGFEMLAELEGTRDFEVIFTTAYDQFILRALRLSAIDYLLKPIDTAQLSLAVARVQKEIDKNRPDGSRINNLMQNMVRNDDKLVLALPSRNSYDFVEASEIIYCMADGAYTTILMAGGKRLVLSRTLGETEKLLPASLFIRIHYSTVINVNYVKQVKKGNSSFVIMANGDKLNVARSKKENFFLKMGIR